MSEDQQPARPPRSKLDYLYQEVLGEIDELLKRIEGIDLDLSNQVQAAEAQLAATVGKLVQASKGIEAVTEKHKEAIQQWTAAKAEEGRQAVQKAGSEQAAELRRIVEQVLQEQAGRALAGAAASIQSAAAVQKEAANRMQVAWGVGIAALFAAAIIGGIIGGYVTTWIAK